MGLKRKQNHNTLLSELRDLTLEGKPAQTAPAMHTDSKADTTEPPAPVKGGLTAPIKKKKSKPKGPSFINTARLLTG